MAFEVVVMEPTAFAEWLAAQSRPAEPSTGVVAVRGQEAFTRHGCTACHTVRGTFAAGAIGPDLTHVGGRLSLGAGILETRPEEFVGWLARTAHIKPGVHMPQFGMLPDPDLQALAAYLHGLK